MYSDDHMKLTLKWQFLAIGFLAAKQSTTFEKLKCDFLFAKLYQFVNGKARQATPPGGGVKGF